MANIDIVHVPYRGAGPAMNDLIAGHVQMFFDLMPVVLPQIAAGKVRALANAGAKRPSALPDVPTVAEQGLPGFDASSILANARADYDVTPLLHVGADARAQRRG
jgi:tripartite-type tricarboxylate transporter receptor subunit TctC